MGEKTTILLDKKIVEMLKKSKDNPRQTYNQLLKNMDKIMLKLN